MRCMRRQSYKRNYVLKLVFNYLRCVSIIYVELLFKLRYWMSRNLRLLSLFKLKFFYRIDSGCWRRWNYRGGQQSRLRTNKNGISIHWKNANNVNLDYVAHFKTNLIYKFIQICSRPSMVHVHFRRKPNFCKKCCSL